eukprot:TRINITY_DN6741_c0_g1_i13.p1 TRINITY_DN6741_c0_g1~~TRINITY_DN6741_c0_g1_i13.p1  ORF type:complete len:389 (+),score=52.13 TRINITY_DN6741_c0_g1_i13:457-1623(+)
MLSFVQTKWTTARIYFLGLATLTLLYYDFVLVSPYTTPFFWSFIVCTFLRKPRDKLVAFLRSFVPPVQSTSVWNPLTSVWQYFIRIAFIARAFGNLWNRHIKLKGAKDWIIFLLLLLLYFGLIAWVSTFDTIIPYSLLLFPLFSVVCFIIIVLGLIFMEAPTLASLGLLLVTVSSTVTVCLFVTIQCTREFIQGASYAQESFLANEQWRKVIDFTPEDITNINETVDTVKLHLRHWYDSTFEEESGFVGGNFFLKEGAQWILDCIEQIEISGRVIPQPILNFDFSDSTMLTIYSMLSSFGQSFAKFGITTVFSVLSFVLTVITSSLTQMVSIFTFLASSFYILQADTDFLDKLVIIIPDLEIRSDFSRKFRKYGTRYLQPHPRLTCDP